MSVYLHQFKAKRTISGCVSFFAAASRNISASPLPFAHLAKTVLLAENVKRIFYVLCFS